MKCPKCGYISFDFNQVCPKCNKDITAERDKLNLPNFRPNTPSLLGALTGEASETNMGLEMPGGLGTAAFEQEDILSHDDSQVIEAMEDVFKDSQDLEIELESSPMEDLGGDTESVDLSGLGSSTEELDMDQDSSLTEFTIGEQTEDLSLDLEDLPVENPEFDSMKMSDIPDEELLLEPNVATVDESQMAETGEATLDLGDLSLEDSGLSLEDEVAQLSDDEPLLEVEDLDETLEEKAEPAAAALPTEESEPIAPSSDVSSEDEDLSLDLESLDLDLELEEHKD